MRTHTLKLGSNSSHHRKILKLRSLYKKLKKIIILNLLTP